MREPQPLRDDGSISEELRHDLTNVRRIAEPPFPFESGLGRLRSSLARRPAGAQGSVWKNWYIVAGCAVVLTGSVVAMRSSALTMPGSPVETPAPSSEAPRATPETPEARVPVPEQGTSLTALPDAPALEKTGKPNSAKAPPPTRNAATSDGVHEELAHMRKLREIAASDPSAALSLAEGGQRRFAAGVFTQEREVIAIEALQKLGLHDDAKLRAARFLAAHPESPFADKVRQFSLGSQ